MIDICWSITIFKVEIFFIFSCCDCFLACRKQNPWNVNRKNLKGKSKLFKDSSSSWNLYLKLTSPAVGLTQRLPCQALGRAELSHLQIKRCVLPLCQLRLRQWCRRSTCHRQRQPVSWFLTFPSQDWLHCLILSQCLRRLAPTHFSYRRRRCWHSNGAFAEAGFNWLY